MSDAIKIDGLDKFVRNLRKLDADLPKALRVGFNEAAAVVVDYAKPKVPRRTGKAAASIRASSTRSRVRISEGGRRAPYMPWLDFGGKAGPGKGVHRPFYKDGRFIWLGLKDRREQVHAAVTMALLDAARAAGVEVD